MPESPPNTPVDSLVERQSVGSRVQLPGTAMARVPPPFRPLHVALAIPHLGGGGAERSTLAIARGLLARGHSVDLLLMHDRVDYVDEIPNQARRFLLKNNSHPRFQDLIRLCRHFGLRILPHLRPRHITQARAIAEYIDEHRPDCLVPSLASPKIASLLAIPLAGFRPAIVPIIRNNILNRRERYRILYRSLFGHADRIVAISHGVAESLTPALCIPQDRITQIYNPVVTARLHTLALEQPPHPWFDDAGPPIILAAGRLVPAKDYPTLLRAFKIVSRHRSVRLLVLGEGIQRHELEQLIANMGMQSSVALPGWTANPYAYMSRAAAFVLSSKYEGLGNVLIEALACGCPCVATDCPYGPREILDHGRYGRLVPVGDYTTLASAIESLLDAPINPVTLRARASRYSIEASVDSYEGLFQQLRSEERLTA